MDNEEKEELKHRLHMDYLGVLIGGVFAAVFPLLDQYAGLAPHAISYFGEGLGAFIVIISGLAISRNAKKLNGGN